MEDDWEQMSMVQTGVRRGPSQPRSLSDRSLCEMEDSWTCGNIYYSKYTGLVWILLRTAGHILHNYCLGYLHF